MVYGISIERVYPVTRPRAGGLLSQSANQLSGGRILYKLGYELYDSSELRVGRVCME
jgi:hypothetical protein